MSTPTYKEFLEGSTTWRKEHKGVTYILSHHGYREGDEYPGAEQYPGAWCYYLLIPEQMFPHRWDDFKCTRSSHGFEEPGKAFNHGLFDSEITWSSSEPYLDRKEERMYDASKVGCGYNHLWHAECGYPDTYSSVNQDAILTIDRFLEANPDRLLRSSWSGKWGMPDQMYTANNGKTGHIDDDIPDNFEGWKRAEQDTPNDH